MVSGVCVPVIYIIVYMVHAYMYTQRLVHASMRFTLQNFPWSELDDPCYRFPQVEVYQFDETEF